MAKKENVEICPWCGNDTWKVKIGKDGIRMRCANDFDDSGEECQYEMTEPA